MSLKIGILSIILLTISRSLAHPNECKSVASILTCLSNKAVEVEIAEDLTCQVTQTSTPKFRDDYTLTPGIGWYKFHNIARNWNDARKICESEGAHLAVINSKAEEKVLGDLINKGKNLIMGSPYLSYAAIGGHNWFGNDDWATILGDSLPLTGYVHWAKGEPNNADGNEHCLSLFSKGSEQGLNDYACQKMMAFVCEKSYLCS